MHSHNNTALFQVPSFLLILSQRQNITMLDLETRLEKIYKEIEKILSLQQEQINHISNLEAENQSLIKKINEVEQQLKITNEESITALSKNNRKDSQNKQEISDKIDELLSEVEDCITLLSKEKQIE